MNVIRPKYVHVWFSFVIFVLGSVSQNERRCECNEGFVGNGVQCLEKAIPPLDRCLEENGGCHPQAICTDLHFEGEKSPTVLIYTNKLAPKI